MRHAHTVEQVRTAEAALMATLPEGTLMQRAAAGLAYAVIDLLGSAYGRRVRLLVADCRPHLINNYLRLGFRTYAKTYNDPTVGMLAPLIFVIDDVAYLERIKSRLAPLFRTKRPGREEETVAKIVDLLEMADPFPYNEGRKRGALVEAKVGQGRWIYIGLGLWRQLPAGTDGAYRLMANLLSLGSRPSASQPR